MKRVLVVGGTGSLGKALVPKLLADPTVERVRIYSRTDHRQAEMAETLVEGSRVDWLVGDIRDRTRLRRAVQGVQEVYHLAATKRVESAEYNPEEAIKTNVLGTTNLVHACWEALTVDRAIYVSTDKAVAPINVYGMSKALAEKVWIQGNVGSRTRFSATRYGNVLGSQGSVLQAWGRSLKRNEPIKLTDGKMTRFFFTQDQAAEFVQDSMRRMDRAEVFIPKMKTTTIQELAHVFLDIEGRPMHSIELMPTRPGEKMHESLIALDEVPLTTEIGDRLIRWPEMNLFPVRRYGTTIVNPYRSDVAEKYTYEELRKTCVSVLQ